MTARSQGFAGRSALVTGAASGIGAAVARWLDAQGVARLVLVDRDTAGLEALALSAQVRRVPGDVADEALWERIEADEGPLDYAVLNAGVADGCAIVISPTPSGGASSRSTSTACSSPCAPRCD